MYSILDVGGRSATAVGYGFHIFLKVFQRGLKAITRMQNN